MNSAYLDNNSTTVIHPEVAQAIADCHAAGYVNPASQHAAGRRARKALEAARAGIGEILGTRQESVHADRIIFTSGGTEANNLAVRGIVRHPPQSSGSPRKNTPAQIVISSIEHPSVIAAAESLRDCSIDIVSVDHQGVLRLEELERIVSPATRCVSVMLGNNEIGTLQPVQQVGAVCRAQGVPVHTDAVQVVGKLPLSFRELGVDALTATAHKFHGPRGIGVLILKHTVDLVPILFGGSQQLGARPGTESVALAVGMQRALEIWQREAQQRETNMTRLRDLMESELKSQIPELVVNGGQAPRLPHTLNVSFPGQDRQALLLALDRAGVACSTGAACTSGSSEPSHVLLAMGCADPIIEGSLRFSLSAFSTADEVQFAVGQIVSIYRQMKRILDVKKGPPSTRESASKRV